MMEDHILIYGAGNLGKQIYESLKQFGIQVDGFLDINAKPGQNISGTPIYCPDAGELSQPYKRDCIVLVAIILPAGKLETIKVSLEAKGYAHVCVHYSLLYPWLVFTGPDHAYIQMQEQKIQEARALFCDSHSREVFDSHMHTYENYSYDSAITSHGLTQYFQPNVQFLKGFSDFVDCGAYTGDTLKEAVMSQKIDNYYAFEPDTKNYQKLVQNSILYKNNLQRLFLFPCGVGAENKYCQFKSGAQCTSALSDNSDSFIQVVKLDHVLKKVPISMIKMDIEGSERDAIYGAANILQDQRPDLCICTYHRISDLWEIPLLLHRFVPQYKFFLRSHAKWTVETVLYATTSV